MTTKVTNNTIHSAKVFLYKKDVENLFLVVQEPEGLYGFVGGAQDEEDKTLRNTAVREIQEEINLTENSYTLTETPITYEFVHTDPKSNRYKKKGVLHAFIARYNESEAINLNPELLQYKWLTKEDVFKYIADSYPYLAEVFQKVIDSI